VATRLLGMQNHSLAPEGTYIEIRYRKATAQ